MRRNAVSVSVGQRELTVRPLRRLALEALHAPPWSGRYALEGSLVLTATSLPSRS